MQHESSRLSGRRRRVGSDHEPCEGNALGSVGTGCEHQFSFGDAKRNIGESRWNTSNRVATVDDIPEAAYGRVTNPQRFEPLIAAGRALVADLERRFEVTVTHSVPPQATESTAVTVVDIVQQNRSGEPLASLIKRRVQRQIDGTARLRVLGCAIDLLNGDTRSRRESAARILRRNRSHREAQYDRAKDRLKPWPDLAKFCAGTNRSSWYRTRDNTKRQTRPAARGPTVRRLQPTPRPIRPLAAHPPPPTTRRWKAKSTATHP